MTTVTTVSPTHSATTAASSSLARRLLRLEGAALLIAALALYAYRGESGLLFAALLLLPDLSMLGYLRGPATGAWVYNAAHTTSLPLGLGALSLLLGWQPGINLALIWAAHIGADRALGYGLKYPTEFKDTHLNRL